MGASLYIPLREQETLKELFQALEENGLTGEKKQVMELADCIDRLDSQLGTVLDEIRDLKQQLGAIQEGGTKDKVLKVVGKAEGKIQEIKNQFQYLKERFITDIKSAVESFKEKGVSALYKAVDFLKLEKGMQSIKIQMNQGMLALDRGIDQLGLIGEEIHEAKSHFGNVGKALIGKEVQKPKTREVEKGMIFQTQKALYYANTLMRKADGQADRFLQSIESLAEQSGDRKRPSVRKALKTIEEGNKGRPVTERAVQTAEKNIPMAEGKKKGKVR